ncbi:hypothetical protein MCOR25_004255 [Pyricularia grisea]|nr:hypothetical protein MCOR25_004255 [Pyricularia grisea]
MDAMRRDQKYTDLVVKVGKGMDEFNLHKAVEAQTGVIELLDVESSVFVFLVDYMYTGKLELPTESQLPGNDHYSLLVGTPWPFKATLKAPSGAEEDSLEACQHISAQAEYKHFSPEELRLADYNRGWRGPRTSISQNDIVPTATTGRLVDAAKLPYPVFGARTVAGSIDFGIVATQNPFLQAATLASTNINAAIPRPALSSWPKRSYTSYSPSSDTLPQLFQTSKRIPLSHHSNPGATCKTILFALRVYTLADRLLVPQLKALCLKKHREATKAAEKDIMWRWHSFGEVIRHTYENEQPDTLKTPLLRLVIKKRWIDDFWKSLEPLMDEIPAFERDVLDALRQATLPGEPDRLPSE